jgi:hypothetical protein
MDGGQVNNVAIAGAILSGNGKAQTPETHFFSFCPAFGSVTLDTWKCFCAF